MNYNMKKTTLFALLFSFFLIGCHSKKREVTQLVNAWKNKEILLPDSLNFKVQGRDTLHSNWYFAKYKIVNYIDTAGCLSCRNKFYDWSLLQRATDSLNLSVAYLFIAWTKKYRELEILQQINCCEIPTLYDTNGEISQLNQFPSHPNFQTFLLDSLNRVILIGNPIENPKIRTLYLKTIKP